MMQYYWQLTQAMCTLKATEQAYMFALGEGCCCACVQLPCWARLLTTVRVRQETTSSTQSSLHLVSAE